MKITWIGHSCFKVETKCGTVVFDPYQDGSVPGYGPVREEAEFVICSHEHGDHNARECVKLPMEPAAAAEALEITQIHTYHDDTKGSQRGQNAITIIDDGEARLAHMGDLGSDLTEEEAAQLSGLDAVLIPVGGYYTIDGRKAAEIVMQIEPNLVIPMHYSNAERGLGYDVITSEQVFLDALRELGYQGEIRYEQGCSAGSEESGVRVLRAANS